jgi:hypothetical protein
MVNVNTFSLTVSRRRQVTKRNSFDEFVSNKRKRSEQICFKCGKRKEIYTHVDGQKDKPLCNGCNMKARRESPGAIQVKLLKLCATAIGSVESMLGLPVEENQRQKLQHMQDELKLLVRVWLDAPETDQEAHAATATAQAADLSTGPRRDEFSDARKVAVGKESDKLFEVSNQPSTRKSRKARAVSKAEGRKTAKAKHDATEAMAEPNIQSEDPAYQEYLEGPLK